MIGGKINCFDNIDYNILINIVKIKLKPDRTLIGLIHKLLKAGYLLSPSTYAEIYATLPLALSRIDAWEKAKSIGDIFSPLFYNIYLTPLDDFIDKLKKIYEKVTPAPAPTNTKGEGPVRYQWQKGGGGIKIYYVRYVDTWVIGIAGPYAIAKKIKEEIDKFLEEELKLFFKQGVRQDATRKKSKRSNLERDLPRTVLTHQVKFLGHNLTIPTPTRTRAIKHGRSKLNIEVKAPQPSPTTTLRVRVLIPLKDLRLKLIKKGFADDNGRPKYIGKFIFLSDYNIVKEYNRILTKILTFYSRPAPLVGVPDGRESVKANNHSRPYNTLLAQACTRASGGKSLSKLIYILEFSLAHTLAAKHRISIPKVFKKYGRPFVITRGESDTIKFAKPVSF